jgi:DNA-binding SARP family transcriptional activator
VTRLHLALFGTFLLAGDDGTEIPVTADKVRALLAVLAVERDRAHRRETLTGLLWPGYLERSARLSLNQATSVLNHLLQSSLAPGDAPPLVLSRSEVRLRGDACGSDVGEFEGLLAACRAHGHPATVLCNECAESLRRALDLYTGAFLAGFSLRDSPEFDEWLSAQRERYHRQAVEATRMLAERDQDQQALAYAGRWAELDPLDEAAHRRAMLLLAAGGRRSQALGQYETCQQLLRAGLAVEPEQATRELYERIRTGDPTLVRAGATPAPSVNLPPPRPSPRHNLPAAVDSFVGREREMVEIRALIGDPGVRLVTLVGAGGMGKTRLALEMARELLDRYPDGVWFVDLAPLPGTLLTAAPLSPQGAGVTGQDSAPALC